MANSIMIHPVDHPRAVVVLETDDANSGFELVTDATAVEAAFYLAKNPSLLVWLPAFAQGELRVFTKNAKVDGQPLHIFDLEVHGLSDVRNDEGKLKGADDLPLELPEAAGESGRWYHFECPANSGQWHMLFCPSGKNGECFNGKPTCV